MIANCEMNIKTLIRHSIDLMRVFLVMRTGILGKYLFQYFNLFCIQSLQTQMPVYIFRNLYIKFLPFAVINKTAPQDDSRNRIARAIRCTHSAHVGG